MGCDPGFVAAASRFLMTIVRRIWRNLRGERGSMLVELLIAMTFLAIAIGALMSVYTSSVLSLRHSSIEGNALTLVDKKLEVYRTLPYASIALGSASIPLLPPMSTQRALRPTSPLHKSRRSRPVRP